MPKLRLPDENDNLVLQTDASDYHWGALLQIDLNEFYRYEINYDYDNIVINDMNTSDYYFSE